MEEKRNTRDMTSGTIWKHIVLFSIPLLIGNFFQCVCPVLYQSFWVLLYGGLDLVL